jgi:hypothetical protein
VIVPAAMLLASCGGGGEESTESDSAEAPETKEELVAAADAVCVEGAKRVNELFNQHPGPGGRNPSTPQELADTLPERVELEKRTLSDLEAIEPPANLATAYGKYVESDRTVVTSYEQALAAANQVDSEAYARAGQAVNASQQGNTNSAAELGLQACASHLPADQKADLNLLMEDIWRHADPAHCDEDYTSAFVGDLGGQDACVNSETDPSIEAGSIEISNIGGVTEISARADVVIHGGIHDKKSYNQAFEFEDGRWKLDQLFPLN